MVEKCMLSRAIRIILIVQLVEELLEHEYSLVGCVGDYTPSLKGLREM